MSVSRTRVWAAAVAAALAGAGCGFKGPLYLPEHNATVITHPARGTQAPGQTRTPASRNKSKTPPPAQPPSPPPASPPSS